jgi:hypothetical protein
VVACAVNAVLALGSIILYGIMGFRALLYGHTCSSHVTYAH